MGVHFLEKGWASFRVLLNFLFRGSDVEDVSFHSLEGHPGLGHERGAGAEVIEESIGDGKGMVVVSFHSVGWWQSMNMRSFVLGAEQEGFFRVPVFEPVECLVGDDLGGVPGYPAFPFGRKKGRVEIGSLSTFAGKNFPMLELIGGVAFEVPFSDQSGLVSGLPKFPGVNPLLTIPLGAVSDHPVGFAVFARQDGRPARTTDRVDVEGMGEEGAFFCDAVEVGGLVNRSGVGSDCAQGMIVAEQEKNVRSAISPSKACKN